LRNFGDGGPPPKPANITPSEVISTHDEAEYASARRQAQRMLEDASEAAMAMHKYPQARRSYEEALPHFKASHPGFSESAYSLALEAAIIDLR